MEKHSYIGKTLEDAINKEGDFKKKDNDKKDR